MSLRSSGLRDYQVRICADTPLVADDLCNRIRLAGGACFAEKQGRAGMTGRWPHSKTAHGL
jgi:hypothetical protein